MRNAIRSVSRATFERSPQPPVARAIVHVPLAWLLANGQHTKGGVP